MKIDLTPISQTFKLETDPDKIAEIVVNQAREGEHIERQDMFSKITRVYDDPVLGRIGMDGKMRLEVEQNTRRLRRREAFLTLGRVTGIVDSKGRELFRSSGTGEGFSVRAAMTEDEFNRAWAVLPEKMADEISLHVLNTNPQWDPEKVGELTPASD